MVPVHNLQREWALIFDDIQVALLGIGLSGGFESIKCELEACPRQQRGIGTSRGMAESTTGSSIHRNSKVIPLR